ncbi:hypothetical protein HKCCE4037_08725 [Rhodobacterales bacterium HKCCE4037]|nr:hypothetical protein [Rhodobacterales bacterium HKCCE4037]
MRSPHQAGSLRRRTIGLVSAVAMLCAGAGSVHAQAPSVGSSTANPAVLARLFASACLQSANLADTQTLLTGLGMVPNPETGTYFHQQFDMSVNPAGAICSMVFLAADPETVADVFRESAAALVGIGAQDIEIIRLEGQADPYYRASVEVQW